MSANTYVLRHADRFGLEKTYKQMKELYSLDKVIHTEINEMTVGTISPERLAYFPWGQDADLSSVQMCQLYNYMAGGSYYIPFYCAKVIRPDGKTIYCAEPAELDDKHLDIDTDTDLLNSALADTFSSYLTEEQLSKYGDLAENRRILAKSGTADIIDESVNRVMMLTVLSEDRKKVICTACMCIDHTYDYNIMNSEMIDKIMTVLKSMDII